MYVLLSADRASSVSRWYACLKNPGTPKERTSIDSGKHVHEFIVENQGTANLKFSVIEKSENVEVDCGTEEQIILPGASLPIGLTLTVTDADQKTGFVEFETNDQLKKVRLVVSGS